MGRLVDIWRHPIKAHGRERLEACDITADQCLPYDREWAVPHEAAKLTPGWSACQNFSRGAKAPGLMAITCALDEGRETITLSHPEKSDITLDPNGDAAAFVDWVKPLVPADRAQPVGLVRRERHGMTDTDFASISLLNLSSHRAVSQAIGRELSPKRWRGNLWVEGLGPWEEFEWIGKSLTIGTATFKVEERITRCRATMASTRTGRVDADTLGVLDTQWGHRDFGIYLRCTAPGRIAKGDTAALT